jgi:phosphinothricin acetyltransferase
MRILREAAVSDVPQINGIVNWYIRETTVDWAWEERSLEEARAWFDGHKPPHHPVYVIDDGGVILAFGSLSHFRPKAGYWPVAENSVYARHDCRGLGLGTALMEKLIEHARASGLRAITAWISDDNAGSVRFHEKLGFYKIGRMPGIGEKFGERLGVVIMQLDLNPLPNNSTENPPNSLTASPLRKSPR